MENEELIKHDNMGKGITIDEIVNQVKKHIILFFVVLIIFIIFGISFNSLKEPEYKSKASLLVQYESGSNNLNSDLNFSNQISNTFIEFIKKDIVLDPVAEKFNISTKSIRDNLTISNNGKSLIVDVSYISNDNLKSKEILNAILDQTIMLINKKNNDNKPVYTMLYNNLQILSYACDGQKVSNSIKFTLIFIFIGLFVDGIILMINVITDNKFKNSDELEKILELPVLACIPKYEIKELKNGEKNDVKNKE